MTEPNHAAAQPRHPAVAAVMQERAADVQLRLADAITKFAGSMPFVYIHVVAFGIWMLVVERTPWPTLTLVVSLEAIFLSTFVMIGQNRQAAIAQRKADHEYVEQEHALRSNTDLTQQIADIVADVQRLLADEGRTSPGGRAPGASAPDPG